MENNQTALYVRVSELGQHPQNQIDDLLKDLKQKGRQLYKHKCQNLKDFDRQAERAIKGEKDEKKRQERTQETAMLRKYLEMGIFIELGHSGTKAKRLELLELLELAQQRQFNILEVWALDRFTREGTSRLFYYISLLSRNKVDFISFREPILDTTSPFRDVILALLAALAHLESLRQGERVKSGIQRIQAAGGKWGSQHEYSDEAMQDMLSLRRIGLGYMAISRMLEERHGEEIKPASIRFMVLKTERKLQEKTAAEANR